jgi:hypothetical protein
LQAATAGGSCNDANNNYRKHFLSLVAGSYASACNTPFVASAFTIDANATFSALGQTVDASGVEAYVFLTQSFATGSISSGATSPYSGLNRTAVVNWVQSGLYYLGGLELPGVASVSCAGNPLAPAQVAPSTIPNKLDITDDVLKLLADKRRVFPKSTCVSYDIASPLVSNVPVYFTGSVLTYGDKSLDLKANRAFENVTILPGAMASIASSPDYEPQFRYNVTFGDNALLTLTYKLSSGLSFFSVTPANGAALFCSLP